MRRVNASGFLQPPPAAAAVPVHLPLAEVVPGGGQQQQQQLLLTLWSSMCCIFATACEFYNCSCGAVGAARAFIAKALQHAKFSSETARLAPVHCVNRAVRPPRKQKAHPGSPRNLLPQLFALEMLVDAALHCNDTVKLQ